MVHIRRINETVNMNKKYFVGARVFITQEVIDYIRRYERNFPPDIFDKVKVGMLWDVKDMYVSGGEVMLQINNGDDWMFVPAYLFYSDSYVEYLRTIC